MHRLAKPAYGKPYRGFESPPLRQPHRPWASSRARTRGDHLVFAGGGEIRRTQFMERVGVGRYRATADDMPLGADVVVEDRRHRYETYRSWTRFRGWMVRVRAREDGVLLEGGSIEGVILVWWHGIPLSRTRSDFAASDASSPGATSSCSAPRKSPTLVESWNASTPDW